LDERVILQGFWVYRLFLGRVARDQKVYRSVLHYFLNSRGGQPQAMILNPVGIFLKSLPVPHFFIDAVVPLAALELCQGRQRALFGIKE
jgi:hypothetical protein